MKLDEKLRYLREVEGASGVFTVHQKHDYVHLGAFAAHSWDSPGARWNLRCIGGAHHLHIWTNATDLYTARGLQPYWPGRLMPWGSHEFAPSRPQIVIRKLWRALALCTRPLRRAFGMVNPRW